MKQLSFDILWEETLKRCTWCGELKPISEFYRDPRIKDGLHIYCSSCCRNRRTEYYRKNRDEIAERRSKHRAENREEYARKKKKYYYANHKAVLESSRRCYSRAKMKPGFSAKNVERVRQYRKANPEKTRRMRTRRSIIRRARLAGCDGSYTWQEWNDILNRYKRKCLRCGAVENISVDHIIPISRGGTNFATNLQPLCISCNAKKHTKYTDYRPDAYWGDWL